MAALLSLLLDLLGVGSSSVTASWYGAPFHGRVTASGEVFDQEAMTYASPSDPFGTRLRCEVGGRAVIVRCNDRGPFVGGRDLDLSRAAARELGILRAGVARVSVWRVG